MAKEPTIQKAAAQATTDGGADQTAKPADESKAPAAGTTRATVSEDQTAADGPIDADNSHHIYDAQNVHLEGAEGGMATVTVNGVQFHYPTGKAVDIPKEHLRILQENGQKLKVAEQKS